MKKKTLPVVFRVFRDGGDVIALFPTIPATMYPWLCLSYQHVGQHGAANLQCLRELRPATATEHTSLLSELESIGYKNLVIRRKAGDRRYTRQREEAIQAFLQK